LILLLLFINVRSILLGSTVSVVTGLCVVWPRVLVWLPAGTRDYPVVHNVQTSSGAHPTS